MVSAACQASAVRRRWIVVAGALVFALVASQVLVPALGERRVEDRLTAGGGTAEVTLGAVPALRLLFSDGERFQVEARDLELELDQQTGVFDRLDGFAIVDVTLADSTAGPFELESFSLSRDGDGPYRLLSSGTTSPSELAAYGLDSFQLPGEGFLDALLDPLLADADVPVELELDMELTSDEGRIQVVSGGGTVAGFPMGPLAELITSAIVVRL
jgi:hypothetical protein